MDWEVIEVVYELVILLVFGGERESWLGVDIKWW